MADKTVTVRPSGGDYTSLQAAIIGETTSEGDLVSLARILTISVEGTWSSDDSTSANVTGFTTNSSYYPVIDVISDSYRLVVAGTALRARTNYMRVYGLHVENTTTSGSVIGLQAQNVTIDRFTCKGGANAIQCVANSNNNYYVSNGVSYGFSGYGIWGDDPSISYVSNCVFSGGTRGCFADYGSTFHLRNCYFGNSSSADLYINSTGQINLTTTYTEDGSRSSPTAAYSTSTFTNVTSGSEDFSLAPGSALIGVGTDLSADATYPFDWDLTEATRITWDVGAYYYAVAVFLFKRLKRVLLRR